MSNSIKTDKILETIVTRNTEAKTPYKDINDLEKHMAFKKLDKVSNQEESKSQYTLSITKVQPLGQLSITADGSS